MHVPVWHRVEATSQVDSDKRLAHPLSMALHTFQQFIQGVTWSALSLPALKFLTPVPKSSTPGHLNNSARSVIGLSLNPLRIFCSTGSALRVTPLGAELGRDEHADVLRCTDRHHSKPDKVQPRQNIEVAVLNECRFKSEIGIAITDSAASVAVSICMRPALFIGQ